MKIVLSGYYGFDNAGDEALLSAITSTIRKIAPDTDFVVLSGYPGKTARLHGLPAVNRMNPCSVIREIRSADLLISGGGSLFQDVTSTRSLSYYISIVALAKMLKKPVIFYAQGIGPINRRFSKALMRLIANRVDLITLRDEDSLLLLKNIGVVRPPTVITADPVFTLEPAEQDYDRMQQMVKGYFPEGEKLIGVSVRKWPALEGYQPLLAANLDRLVQKGYQLLFIPMDYPEDALESQRITALMQEDAPIIEQALTSQEHIALISQLELIIGMRLHSLIFAASREVPFLGISYDPKIDAFLKLFDFTPLPLEESQMNRQIDDILHNSATRNHLREKSRELKVRAEETAYLALSLVEGRLSKEKL